MRSRFASEAWSYTTARATIVGVGSEGGRLGLLYAPADPSAFVTTDDRLGFEKPTAGFEYRRNDDRPTIDFWAVSPPEADVGFLGARYRRGQFLYLYARDLTLPLWMPTVASAVLPAVRGMRLWNKSRRRRRGLCPACGYDLTGNVSGVCPECGARVRKSSGVRT